MKIATSIFLSALILSGVYYFTSYKLGEKEKERQNTFREIRSFNLNTCIRAADSAYYDTVENIITPILYTDPTLARELRQQTVDQVTKLKEDCYMRYPQYEI